jgi:hypothetical protein
MRKAIILAGVVIMLLGAMPLSGALASPDAQFAGCADEEDLATGLVFIAREINGVTLTVSAVGIDGFDPQITALDAETGDVLTCNNDAGTVEELTFNLPTAIAGPSDTSAEVQVTVAAVERRDIEFIITGNDGSSGEFVLMLNGPEVFGSGDIDFYGVRTSEGQAESEVPLAIYVANLGRPELAYDPYVVFRFGEDFEQDCGKSSSPSLCQGDHEDLTGYTITLDAERIRELNGDDVMLSFQLGGEAAEFDIDVGSYQQRTFGPYWLLIHSGVGELAAAEG